MIWIALGALVLVLFGVSGGETDFAIHRFDEVKARVEANVKDETRRQDAVAVVDAMAAARAMQEEARTALGEELKVLLKGRTAREADFEAVFAKADAARDLMWAQALADREKLKAHVTAVEWPRVFPVNPAAGAGAGR